MRVHKVKRFTLKEVELSRITTLINCMGGKFRLQGNLWCAASKCAALEEIFKLEVVNLITLIQQWTLLEWTSKHQVADIKIHRLTKSPCVLLWLPLQIWQGAKLTKVLTRTSWKYIVNRTFLQPAARDHSTRTSRGRRKPKYQPV
jgi:hypothetical protein